ncbi:MAG: alpha-galactosidase [Chloroflexi bacterium]|nr:alpha-galactosidase [Chloroflexota bacterium]
MTIRLFDYITNPTAFITYRDTHNQTHRLELAGNPIAHQSSNNRVTLSLSDDIVELQWHAIVGEEFYAWLEISNHSAEPIHIDELHVLSLDAAHGANINLGVLPPNWRMFQNGWQSWSATYVRDCSNGVHLDPATEEYNVKHQPHPVPASPKTIVSEWFTVMTAYPLTSLRSAQDDIRGQRSSVGGLLLGFVSAANQLGEIRLQLDNGAFVRLDALNYADGVRVDPGEKFSSEKLLVAFGEPLTLLDKYAMCLGTTMHARIPTTPLTGWCTWYYFFGQNTASDVIANVERIRAERLPLDTIVIDDGYQTSDGDWTSIDAEKFPNGMKSLADEIRRAGLVPGIWLAPFAANENSQLARNHPEFLLRDEKGEPVFSWRHWGAKCFSLDLSRADVQDWLRNLFRTLSDDWGYDFFKLDFLYTAAAPGVHHDPKMTRAQAVRRGLEIIRETVGDKMILGCGAPLGPSVGVVDAMRIGPDVSINWEPIFHGDLTEPSTAYAMRNTLARAFMHNRLWHNDPDCVLARRRDDESALKLNEMRTMVSIIGLSGSAVLSSDNLPSIRRGRLKYLKQILPTTNIAARPIDLFEHELAQLFALPVKTDWGEWLVVGAINWEDKTAITQIDLEKLGLDPTCKYHVYNYWHRRYVGIVRERVTIKRHQPHETRVLLFKPVSEQIDLLTTTFHIAQGLVEVKKVERERWSGGIDKTKGNKGNKGNGGKEILRVELEKSGRHSGDVIFAIPKTRKLIAAKVDGRVSPHRSIDKGIVAVGLTLDEKATVEIEVSG